jgi:hypothetical protein
MTVEPASRVNRAWPIPSSQPQRIWPRSRTPSTILRPELWACSDVRARAMLSLLVAPANPSTLAENGQSQRHGPWQSNRGALCVGGRFPGLRRSYAGFGHAAGRMWWTASSCPPALYGNRVLAHAVALDVRLGPVNLLSASHRFSENHPVQFVFVASRRPVEEPLNDLLDFAELLGRDVALRIFCDSLCSNGLGPSCKPGISRTRKSVFPLVPLFSLLCRIWLSSSWAFSLLWVCRYEIAPSACADLKPGRSGTELTSTRLARQSCSNSR